MTQHTRDAAVLSYLWAHRGEAVKGRDIAAALPEHFGHYAERDAYKRVNTVMRDLRLRWGYLIDGGQGGYRLIETAREGMEYCRRLRAQRDGYDELLRDAEIKVHRMLMQAPLDLSA